MLRNIHNLTKGWIAWTIISIIAMTFLFWGIQNFLQSRYNASEVAKVNDREISQNDFRRAYEQTRNRYQQQLGENFVFTPQLEQQLKQATLNNLILNEALINSAQNTGFYVSTPQIQNLIQLFPQFQLDGKFSPERFRTILQSVQHTPQSFMQKLQRDMIVNQARSGLMATNFLPDALSKSAVQLINQERDFNYLIIPKSQFAKTVHVTDQQIKDYFDKNQSQFQSPEMVSIEYVELTMANILDKVTITDDEIKAYYQNNIKHFTQPAKWQVAHILIGIESKASDDDISAAKEQIENINKRLKAGDKFAELAKQFSTDFVSAKKGGELPWFSAGVFTPEFEKTVAGLNKKGDISPVIRTQYGFEIIKLLDKKPAAISTFKEVKANLAKTLKQQKATKKFTEISNDLASLAYTNPDSLTSVSNDLHLKIHQSVLFNRQGTKNGISQYPTVVAAAFSTDVLEDKNNSDLIQITPDHAVVLRVYQHQPAKFKELSSVKKAISDVIKDQLLREQTQKLGTLILSSQEMAKKHIAKQGLKWHLKKNIKRSDTKLNSNIVTAAFQLQLAESNEKSTLKGLNLPNGDFALVKLTAVHFKNNDLDNKEFSTLKQQIETANGQIEYQLYVQSVMKSAKIETNTQNINRN